MPTSTTTKRLADRAFRAVRSTGGQQGLAAYALIGRLTGHATLADTPEDRDRALWALREVIAAARQVVNPENNRSAT